ncbi:hypothetical protein LshimejAT787_2000050 [Lyophyllum shimeji]|uniref:Uncharacterized protein n=1 Tax=Lyophyllum shimeji TaxID=47721 RepID=A0A9P3UUU2_LYOSH|nr:hypothetical protein LshimejAT787_2000050 [Lyophyllum shimeji]
MPASSPHGSLNKVRLSGSRHAQGAPYPPAAASNSDRIHNQLSSPLLHDWRRWHGPFPSSRAIPPERLRVDSSLASITPAHRKSIVQSDSRPTHKMSPSATSSPALTAAAIFLTRPLLLFGFLPQRIVLSLQLFLCSALSSPSSTSSANSNSQVLSFTPTSLPPLPIQLACVAFSIKWTAWIQALGGAAFDLVMEPGRVYVVKKATGQIGPRRGLEAHDESEDEFDIDDAPSSRPSSRSSMLSSSSSSSVLSSHSSHSSATSISSAPPSKTPVATKPTQPTKYIYQGGVSSVLTGGVMLGASSSAPSSSQKHAAPAQLRRRCTPRPIGCALPSGPAKLPDPGAAVLLASETTPVTNHYEDIRLLRLRPLLSGHSVQWTRAFDMTCFLSLSSSVLHF